MRLIIFIMVLVVVNKAVAQPLNLQQKICYTSKVWGFVKYFHSNVSTCQVNWDSVLLHTLPLVKAAATNNEFNDALDTMLLAAGPMALSTTYFPDTIALELKRNRDFSWIADVDLRSDVRIMLDTIRNNFRPHDICWVEVNPSTAATFGGNGGYLLFPKDEPLLNVNTFSNYPDEYNRLLLSIKLINIISYFNPYNYVLDKPVDSILYNNVLSIDTASTPVSFYNVITRIKAGLNDAHVEGLTYSDPITYSGEYVPKLMLRYIQGKYVVVRSAIATIPVGDAIVAVNGSSVASMEDSLAHCISAGNISVLRRAICQYGLFSGKSGTSINVAYADTFGAINTATLTRNTLYGDSWFPPVYYPADSLANIKWNTFGCGVGYINTSQLSFADADNAYQALYNAPAIVVDLRNLTSTDGGADELALDMTAVPKQFGKFTLPDTSYPGTFYWEYDTIGYNTNATPYNGTVIILINQETQSHTEFYSMEFNSLPKIVKMGSQTAGSDANVSYFQLAQDLHFGFTNIGAYYPNGDSTQRIGIVPDVLIGPTVSGIMQGRDEVLEKALQLGCALGVSSIPSAKKWVTLYPNPVNDVLIIDINENMPMPADVFIDINDVKGNSMMHKKNFIDKKQAIRLDLTDFIAGMYFVKVAFNGETDVKKIFKK